MATSTKKTPAQKIQIHLANLAKVSLKNEKFEKLLSKVSDPDVKEYMVSENAEKLARAAADISYLRQRIMYQASQVADSMGVEKFSKFGAELQKLLEA